MSNSCGARRRRPIYEGFRALSNLPDHLKGLLITGLGVIILSPDSLLVRLIGTDAWTLMFWRGLLQFAGIAIILFCFKGWGALGAFRAIGLWGLPASLCLAASNVSFVTALAHTTVANTLVILAAAPFFAAILSGIFLRERVAFRTWGAIACTFAGIGLLVSDSLSSGGLGSGSLIGDLAALVAALSLGASFTILRHARHINMIPALALAALLTAAVAFPLASPGSLSETQFFYTLLMGLLLMPLSGVLIILGPRYLPAPEVSLMLLLETVLGPIWVWLVVAEEPGRMTLAGGAIVVAALVIHSLLALAQERRLRSAGSLAAAPGPP